jgi:2-polyprenyl-3-methyl-5-hydroxy-6-metoxy-1,4-benzoquinol methylase
MDAEYGQVYRELYERHWWWRAREEFLLRLLRRHFAGRPPMRILDVGCGDGLFFDRLSVFGEVEGVEPDASLIRPDSPHRQRIHVTPFDGSFQPARRYDLILMLDVLEHLPAPDAALRHALSLLSDRGLLLITVPAFPMLWTHHDDINHHFVRFTRSSFLRLARSVGARIDYLRYFFHWVFFAKLGAKAWERVRAPRSVESVPRPTVNRFLLAASRIEQKLLSGVSVPFGTSLVAVCERAH